MRWFAFGSALCLALALAAGCATYHAKPISAEQAAQAFEARSLADPGLKAFLEANLAHEISPWPRRSWDPAMLTLAAFYYHPDLDVARAKWGVSKAGIKAARARPNPTLNFAPQYATNADIGTSPWVLPFTLDIPIETPGKRGYRVAQAKQEAEASRLHIATVAWEVRSRLRNALLDLHAAARNAEILRQQLARQEEHLKILEGRASENLLSPLILTEEKLARSQEILALEDARNQEAEARVKVATALGVTVHALDGIEFMLDAFDHPPERLPSSDVRRAALLGRPDILAALADYAAADAALRLEIAKQVPDVSLGPGYEFDQGENKWGLGLSITLPILNQNRGAIAVATARRTEMAATFNALQAQVIGEIDQTRAGYETALQKFKVADRLLAAQRDEQRLIEASAGAGEVRRVALLQAGIEFDVIALARLNALVNVERALGLLEDAVQRPLDVGRAGMERPADPEKNPRADGEAR